MAYQENAEAESRHLKFVRKVKLFTCYKQNCNKNVNMAKIMFKLAD